MKPDKAPGYWPTRILLTIAIVATALTVAFALVWPVLAEPFSGDRSSVLGLPLDVVRTVLPVGLALVGLIWSIRIIRGPRDEPPAWRYRDR
jgi:TRAP-type C4-dicarboxylate transport system permease small subunit